ncbi:hypothetical protein P7K49_000906 [Saguinus oedipus]|uniref:Uncharacterized protein n=1 Tax=Saguinus oedipus TaxID=9490 RepID=A0ABQ9WDJ6_SAGOE|nr:hypothetical protein P7K49_000906 [Saguinus oedipus]
MWVLQEKNPIGIEEVGNQPLGAACRDEAGAGPPAAAERPAAPPPRAPSSASRPALRSAADMCAARMPPLAHIFRGTFVHSTWACPMEVLRDHLLGVSDSGKVSGRGVGRTPTGGRTGRGSLGARGAPRLRS